MSRPVNNGYSKRTQKDYTLSFKLQVVQEIEQGLLTRTQALNKYGIQAGSTIRSCSSDYDLFLVKNRLKLYRELC